MRSTISLSLLGGALALSNEKIEFVAQTPLIKDACPSNHLLDNGKCLPLAYGDSPASTFAFQSNTTQPSHPTNSLEDARVLASQTENFPWTFWPECFTHEKVPDQPYCVFSDQNFASGRGIFIVTAQTFAYAMLEHDAFQRPQTLEHINRYENPPFEQHEFPGKGRGLVANKTLNQGDQIFASTPILITDPDLYELPESERLALLHRGIATLPKSTQSLFWELHGHTPDDDEIDDRITTNNFEVAIDGISQSALFPEIAMLNHDCRPNAAYFFDERTLTHYVHAIRPIHPGEEITITYINNELPRARRIHGLEKSWGFKCSCSTCTAHPALAAESDARLEQIASLQSDILNDWTESSSATPATAELLISLYKQERLDASLATAYQHAAEVYSSFGMKWEAVRYARLSVDMSMLDKGWGDKDVAEMKKMIAEPEKSWSWKKRVSVKSGGCGCGKNH
jgi:hypothetical protein